MILSQCFHTKIIYFESKTASKGNESDKKKGIIRQNFGFEGP